MSEPVALLRLPQVLARMGCSRSGWYKAIAEAHGRPAYGNILWGCQAQFQATPLWCPLKALNHTSTHSDKEPTSE